MKLFESNMDAYRMKEDKSLFPRIQLENRQEFDNEMGERAPEKKDIITPKKAKLLMFNKLVSICMILNVIRMLMSEFEIHYDESPETVMIALTDQVGADFIGILMLFSSVYSYLDIWFFLPVFTASCIGSSWKHMSLNETFKRMGIKILKPYFLIVYMSFMHFCSLYITYKVKVFHKYFKIETLKLFQEDKTKI